VETALMLGIVSPLLSSVPGVSHRFFGRIGGTSPVPWNALNTSYAVSDAPARVDENLARVRFQLGVGKHALFSATQVHGADVVVVDDHGDVDEVAAQNADALVTRARGMAVGVRTADCAPILLAVDDGSAVAAAHAGWRGATGGVVQAAVAALGAPPSKIVAAVGPCIGPRAFEVGPEVVAAAAAVVDVDGLVTAGQGDRAFIDLAGLCVRLLQKAGIERIDVVGGCTVEQGALYFSHRREHGKTGRQMSAIALATPPSLDDETFR
jgi:hypothetical protein